MPEGEPACDAALMEQLARREPAALQCLYNRYARRVYSLVLRVTTQAAVAEEIVQDVFLQLWRNAHLYQSSRGGLGAWLMTVARNRALDHLRGKHEKQRQREDALDSDPAVRVENAMEEIVDQQRRADRVCTLMGSLPAPQRRAIELAYFEGLTHSEIAAAMNEPLGTVKSWIRNGLIRLRENLEENA